MKELERLAGAGRMLREQVAQRIVGQTEVVDGILTAILSGGHALLIGVPGLVRRIPVSRGLIASAAILARESWRTKG